LWINVIMDTFASIALCSEPPRPGLMLVPPKKRDENILTRSMIWNIFTTAGFFVVVMITLLVGMEGHQANPETQLPEQRGWFAGEGAWSSDFPELTVRQVTIFFTAFVLFQVWNEINCRSLVPEVSGFKRLFRNPVFLSIVGLTLVIQVLIVNTFVGEIFRVEPLGFRDWLMIVLFTSSVLLFAEVTRRVRLMTQQVG
jgi:Ca2+-transporting ATPase